MKRLSGQKEAITILRKKGKVYKPWMPNTTKQRYRLSEAPLNNHSLHASMSSFPLPDELIALILDALDVPYLLRCMQVTFDHFQLK